MPASDDGNALEKSAIFASFWIGGCGLTALKMGAYFATGSVLVRTSMFESLGDVISSTIMFVTQLKMNDTRDVARYPVGKGRFGALGVLFFCAFMCSSMSSMAIDSFQSLISSEEDASSGVDVAFKSLFTDKPYLRFLAGGSVESLVTKYTDASDEEGSGDVMSLVILFVCVVTKALLYTYCRGVQRKYPSDLVGALGDDHRNDTISCAVVMFTMGLLSMSAKKGWESPWLAKVDPGVSVLLALWIVYGWITNALEQIQVLSDQRADEDAVDLAAVRAAAEAALKGSSLELCGADAYHIGEGFRVQLKLAATSKSAPVEALSAVEDAVRGVSDEVRMVDVALRGPSEKGNWVKEYSSAVGA